MYINVGEITTSSYKLIELAKGHMQNSPPFYSPYLNFLTTKSADLNSVHAYRGIAKHHCHIHE